jgi:Holliday junction resolvase
MVDTPRESTVVNNIIKYLKGLPQCYVFKTHGNAFQQGQPDVLGVYQGRALAIEVKRPGGKYGVTKLQAATLAKWKAAGAITGVARSVEDVQKIFSDNGIKLLDKE